MRAFISLTMRGRSDEDIRNDIRKAKAVARALIALPADGDSTDLVKKKLHARKLLQDNLLPDNIFCEPLSFMHNMDCTIPEDTKHMITNERLYYLGEAFKQISKCDALIIYSHENAIDGTGVIMEKTAAFNYGIAVVIQITEHDEYYTIDFLGKDYDFDIFVIKRFSLQKSEV